MINENQLRTLNNQGIIPGPEESEMEFMKRASYCLDLDNEITRRLQNDIPFDEKQEGAKEILCEAFTITTPLFDIAPDWIPIFFSNDKLSMWHGGCAWIFQIDASTPPAALFQLRKPFRNRRSYLGIYDRSELIAHEMCHVGRMMFDEPQFEEMLAYRTASSSFRRWFGPIVQSARESMYFLLSIVLILVMDLLSVTTGAEKLYYWSMWLKFIPLGLFCFGILRLWKKHGLFSKCLSNLHQLVHNDETANAIIFRLTDEEIRQFSSMTPGKIKEYAKTESDKSLRWKAIHYIYMNQN